MATSTFTAIAEASFHEPGLTGQEVENRLGYKLTAATIGNTSFTTTDIHLLKMGAEYLSARLRGRFVYFATAAESRVIDTISISVSTVTINFLGGNATNQAGATTAYITLIPWAELKTATNAALEYIPCQCLDVLRHGPDDAFMQANNTTSWTGTNGTVAKQTTAAEVLHGQRSTSLTLTSDGGYMTGTTVRVGQMESAIMYALAKADTGTMTLRALDQSGNTISSGYDVTLTQEQWMFLRKDVRLESGDEGIALRVLGASNNDQIDIQGAWLVNQAENVFGLPSYIDDRFKLKAVAVRHYLQGGQENDTWLAKSYRDIRLQENVDYRFINNPSDANTLGLEMITDHWRARPIMLYAEAPYSAPYGVAGTFSADSDTTTCPAHLLTAYLKKWVGGQMPGMFPDAFKMGEREIKERQLARRTELPTPPAWRGPVGTRRI